MKTLQNKVAIVTGASRGIGAAITRILADAGAKVVVNYVRNQQAADKICAEITAAGGECLTVKSDVSQAVAVGQLFDTAINHYGKIDILINNAGILIFKEIEKISDDEFDRIVDINLKSIFYTLREAATRLSDNGRIINISSTVTRLMLPKYGAYAATKGAVEQLTHIFAKEMGVRGITVNAVLPGPVNTELFRAEKTAEDIKRMAGLAAMGRIGEPEDIARTVLFLTSEESGWITGQSIGINGGII